MSLIRLGRRSQALAKAKHILLNILSYRRQHTNTELSATFRMSPAVAGSIVIGYIANLRNIIQALESPDEIPADDFDPMLV